MNNHNVTVNFKLNVKILYVKIISESSPSRATSQEEDEEEFAKTRQKRSVRINPVQNQR